MFSTFASLLLGMLSGANLLFAVLLIPAFCHLVTVPSTRSYAVHLLSVYFLFCGALSGMGLVLLFGSHCIETLSRVLLSLVCASYWLAWQQLRSRLLLGYKQASQQQVQTSLQVLNTAQLAVTMVLFMRLVWADVC